MTGLLSAALTSVSLLIIGGTVYDGLGSSGVSADVRVVGDRIVAVGRLKAKPGEVVVDASGLVVSPGFIDAHSHADSAIASHPLAESQIRQGITTAVVGQDGGGTHPIAERFATLEAARPAINFAAFAGHGVIRRAVMGEDFRRAATSAEIAKMKAMLLTDMEGGALGVSSGLEYDPGSYATIEELVALAKTSSSLGGIYISHVRDEGNGIVESVREVIRIAREAKTAAQISHIKLATYGVWGKADAVLRLIDEARAEGLDITADLYPYTFWQSTITVLTLEKNWDDKDVWVRALADVGGPKNVLLSQYTPNPNWEGLTLEEIARSSGQDPVSVIQEIVRKTHFPNSQERESIVCTAMAEHDVRRLLASRSTMFCSDGSIGGSHPRGAGAFPRFFARYVRQQGTITFETAIWKATGFPAARFGLNDRGSIAIGKVADIVVFDPESLADKSTTKNPRDHAVGMRHVIVNGVLVLADGRLTGARPGRIIRRHSSRM